MASIASTRLTELSLKSNFLSQNIKVSGESKFEVKPTGLAIVCQQNDISKISRRTVASSILLLPFLTSSKAFALLEEDDDEELLLRVKRDRKSKIEKRESLGSYKSEAAAVQKAVYKLSSVGQALEEEDLSKASSILGADLETVWIKDTIAALTKVGAGIEEKALADEFISSVGQLQSSVASDVETSKATFFIAASSLEQWIKVTGLSEEILGL